MEFVNRILIAIEREKMEPFALSRADKESMLWQRLREHIKNRLQVLRLENDNDMPENERNKKLGRIAELKALEALDNEPVTVPGQHWKD